jgi:radical SAM protein with 4Fe4S-binding SPASM domain
MSAFWQAQQRLMFRMGAVQPPEAVQWISTSACDLSCPHCYSEAGKRASDELTTDEAKHLVIDELVRLNRPTFVIAGGETLLRRDFEELVEYAYALEVPWAIHTHGGHVAKHVDLFRRCPPVMAAVSVDGPEAYHDAFRGRQGSYARAMEAIRILKNAGVTEVVVGTTIQRDNANLLADMFPDIRKSGADLWGFHLMTPEGRAGRHRELLPTPLQLRRVAAYARRLRESFRVELDNEWGSAGSDDCFYRETEFACGAGRFSFVISSSGDAFACTTTDQSESQGNVRDRSLSKIWAQGFAAFRQSGDPLRSDVRDCWLQTRNGCSCRASAFSLDLLSEHVPASTAFVEEAMTREIMV